MIEHVVTGMVLHESLTGYEIKKEIEIGIGNFYKSSNGNLYPTLKKLTEKGHLILTEQTQVSRLKKYYRATELGKAAFFEWLQAPLDANPVTPVILTKVFFFGVLEEDKRRKLLQAYELYIQKNLDRHKEMEAQLLATNMDKTYYYGVSTLYYCLQNIQGMLRWLKYIEEQKPLSEFLSDSEPK